MQMVSFNCRLDTTWKRVSMRDCLDQDGPWACLWGIVLIVLIDVGRLSLKVGGTIPWFGALDCISVEKARGVYIHFFFS